METLRLRLGLDAHAHARQGAMAQAVVPFTAQQFGAAIWMPNTRPEPILTGAQAVAYGHELNAIAHVHNPNFRSFPIIQLTETTTRETIRLAAEFGIRGVKVYPRNVTTNSDNGVANYDKILPALEEVHRRGMVASFHGEHPSWNVEGLDKEKKFLDILETIIHGLDAPLQIVLEHITTHQAVQFVRDHPNMFATITPHHLLYTEDDVNGYSQYSGGKGNPHLICKPKIKMRVDRDALVNAAISGSAQFFLGTDTAPHSKYDKSWQGCSCGAFNAPVVLPVLAALFEAHKVLERLEAFTAVHGYFCWGIEPSDGYVTLAKDNWQVPREIPVFDSEKADDAVIPMMAGETLTWKVTGLEV